MVDGHPAEPRNINVVGLRQAGFSDDDVRALKDVFRQIFNRKDNKPKAEVVAELRQSWISHLNRYKNLSLGSSSRFLSPLRGDYRGLPLDLDNCHATLVSRWQIAC